MTIYTKGEKLTQEEMALFEKSFKDLSPTGETVVKNFENGSITKVVFKGNRTPWGAIRDCGDHYIEALSSRYDRISKDLQTVTEDVEDF